MRTIRNFLVMLVLGGAALGAALVAYFDPPPPSRTIETTVTLPEPQ